MDRADQAFLTCSQVALILLAWGPHFEQEDVEGNQLHPRLSLGSQLPTLALRALGHNSLSQNAHVLPFNLCPSAIQEDFSVVHWHFVPRFQWSNGTVQLKDVPVGSRHDVSEKTSAGKTRVVVRMGAQRGTWELAPSLHTRGMDRPALEASSGPPVLGLQAWTVEGQKD
jgi:hypothetical protein